MRTTVIRALAILALLFVFTSMVFGQAETGQITGTVTDPSGAIVPGAKVTITDVNTNASRTGTTNSSGSYTFTNLKPSTYDVVVEGSGFAKFTRRIDVTVGSKNEVSAQMSVTGGGTTVEVTAEGGAAQVNTESQTLSSVVTAKSITELPTLTRNPYDLVAVSGNVESDPSNRGSGYAINGQRSASTDILLDGGENVDLFTATVGQQVPLDSVQELRIVTSDFTAEYGRASGGVVNVATKSGTNTFHGTAYEFNRVSKLAANTYNNDANHTPKSPFTRNQFGYSIGGPVVKNKLFFFNNTEWIRVRSTSNTTQNVIDPAFLSAYANTNSQNFFSAYGSSLRPGASVIGSLTCGEVDFCASSLFGATHTTAPFLQTVSYGVPSDAGAGSPENTYMTVARVDYNFSDKTTLFGRYALFSENDFPGTVSFSPYAGYDTPNTNYNNNVMINLTHVFTPNFVSQSKVVFNRLNNNQPLGSNPVGPTLYFSASGVPVVGSEVVLPGYLSDSPGNAIPFGGPQNLYQFYQDLSWTKGKHQFRFGGQYIHTRDNRTFGAYETAVESLSESGDYSQAVDNLVAGNLGLFESAVNPQGKFPCTRYIDPALQDCTVTTPVGPPSFERNNRYNDGAVYVQDSWKIKPRLTLNLGLRWEYYGVQHNANPNLDSNFYPGSGADVPQTFFNGAVLPVPQSPDGNIWNPSKKNFAPRIGFAWDIFGDGKTSLRGGYGISYERNFGNVTYNIIQNPPAYAVVSISPSDTVSGVIPITNDNAGPLSGTGASVALPPVSLRPINPNLKNAYSNFYSLSLEREVLKNSVLAFEYTGSHGVHLYDLGNINKAGIGSAYDPANTNGLPCDVPDALGFGLPYGSCRLLLAYGNANLRGSQGGSKYNALNTRFTTNNLFNKGLQMSFNWTWSHTTDNLSNTFSEGPDGGYQLGYVDYFHPNLDWGNSEFDARHRISIGAVWDIPFGKKSSNGFVRQALGGWSISPIVTYRTGQPFSVYDCTIAVYNCPRLNPGAVAHTGSANASTATGPNSFNYITFPIDPTIDWGTYLTGDPTVHLFGPNGMGTSSELPYNQCQGASGCIMNVGNRNTFTGPGNHQFNAVLAKTFKLSERFNLQFRGEMYNVFNNHNFFVNTSIAEAISMTVGGTAAGPSTNTSFVTANKGGTGLSTDERRNVQFGLKLIF